jgi:glucose/mannose transport system substrate-binding protein
MKKLAIALLVLGILAAIGMTATAEERKLEIFHWWVGPGERDAADVWFKVLHDKHPEVEVVENPVAGGGGVSHRWFAGQTCCRLAADTFQALGGAEISVRGWRIRCAG